MRIKAGYKNSHYIEIEKQTMRRMPEDAFLLLSSLKLATKLVTLAVTTKFTSTTNHHHTNDHHHHIHHRRINQFTGVSL
jgi:hypothetical protein